MTDPPDDPQDWTDEEWLAWLAEGDAEAAGQDPGAAPGPAKLKQGAVGTVLGSAMLGLANAIYGPREEAAEVIQVAGGPPEPGWLDLHLDPDHPEDSVAVVRPHDDRGDPL
ncbi:MAG: hypothetical protein ACRDZW_06260 [Acidimicrobiales bacterium]